MSRVLKVAVNRQIINKIPKGDKKLFSVFTKGFENIETTLVGLASLVNEGHPFCAQHMDKRKNENFICSDVLAVDIDDGMTLSEALESAFAQQYGGFIYPTVSHTQEHPRLRFVFELEQTITSADKMTAAQQGLIRVFNGDESCKDACRAFYGSKGSEPILLGKVLSREGLELLIALGRDPAPITDRCRSKGKNRNYPIAARRSGVQLAPDHLVTQANGETIAFELVPFGESIHCPVHLDRNPSAFIVKSKHGNKGVYCHSCAATFWLRLSGSTQAQQRFDFYRMGACVKAMENEQDPGSFYDEIDAPPGLIEQAYAERTVHTLFQKFLRASDIHIRDGVTLLSSEKGSGKSVLLANKVAAFRAKGHSVLFVGHRQSLIQTTAAGFGMTCYFDIVDGEFKYNRPTPYFAICVDSIFKRLQPKRDKYDVIIIDESEQVFSHLTGSTLKDKRRASYMQLFHYMAVAKCVIVADADLGAITVEGVYQAVGPDVDFHLYFNDYRTGKENQRDFHYYDSESHLTQELLRNIGAGGRHYVATNSITKANELQAAIRFAVGNVPKIMLVTSETVQMADVQRLIKNISTEILQYDVVIASPTLGTGIDITFPDSAQHVDTVYGFFVSRVNTHFDIDQQLARVRHPKAIRVWVSPETFKFETEPEVILREAETNGMLNDILVGYKRDGSPELDATYLNVYAHVTSIARASKNNLRENLLELRKRNGWSLVHVDIDPKVADIGKVVKQVAKTEVEEQRIEDVCDAKRLSAEDYGALRESVTPLGKKEKDAVHRYEIESFYYEAASPGLLALDNKGTYRRQLGLLELYLSPTEKLVERDSNDFELATIMTDRKKRVLKQLTLKGLLIQAGLGANVKFGVQPV
jgi:hypothetical protein